VPRCHQYKCHQYKCHQYKCHQYKCHQYRGLYQKHHARQGDRDTLPPVVQDEIMVHEIVNKQRVKRHNVESTGQKPVNDELTDVVADQTRKTRKFLGGLFG